MPGVSGLLTANPFYNKPGQEGQYRHFRAIAEAVPCPVVLYNIPGRTGVNLEPATILRLAEDVPNIQGVKESSGNLQQIAELIHSLPPSFAVLAGDDLMALPVIALGGAGLVSVASNEIPAEMARMVSGGARWRLGDRPCAQPPLLSSDHCQFLGIKSWTREVCDGHDGPPGGKLSPAHGACDPGDPGKLKCWQRN